MDCFYPGNIGGPVVIIGEEHLVASPEACQMLCKHTPFCWKFIWYFGGRCDFVQYHKDLAYNFLDQNQNILMS